MSIAVTFITLKYDIRSFFDFLKYGWRYEFFHASNFIVIAEGYGSEILNAARAVLKFT